MVKKNLPVIVFAAVALLIGIVAFFISCARQIQEMDISQRALMVALPNVEWVKQYGDAYNDIAYAAAADSSGVYSAGNLSGTLPGQTPIGSTDSFIVKHNAEGTMLWARQFGTDSSDYARGIWADSSGIYVTGYTGGAFEGQPDPGGMDAFIIKYASNGNLLWARQFGGDATDKAFGVCANASGIYVAGETYGSIAGQSSLGGADLYLAKFNQNGDRIWTKQFGTTRHDIAHAAYADSSGVYVTGYTYGKFAGQPDPDGTDAYIVKYSSDGQQLWVRQFGSGSTDVGNGVSGNSSGIYVAGYTQGALPGQGPQGSTDAFLIKFSKDGTLLWTRQFGTSASEYGEGVAADDSGVYVGGYTYGTLSGGSGNQGRCDAFARKYSDGGDLSWTVMFGTDKHDYAKDLCVNSSGIYVVGDSMGLFPGETQFGRYDAFIGKITAGPPPDTTPPAMGASLKSRDWAPDNISVVLSISDDSGVKSSDYAWGPSEDTPENGWSSFKNGETVIQKKDGIWFLHLRAEDNAGNSGSTYFGAYNKDSLPPQISVLSPQNKAIYLHNEIIPLTLTVIDALSGIKSSAISLDGNDVTGQNSIGPLDPGAHVLEVTAEDYAGNSVSTQLSFNVKLVATIDFDPDTLNLTSQGNWCTVYITFPPPHSVSDIDNSSILLNGALKVDPEAPSEPGMVKFDRSKVQEILEVGDQVKIVITGQFDGKAFEGLDIIRVIEKGTVPEKTEKPEKKK